MIRICHIQVFPLLSGVQRSMLEIFKQLDRSRFEIHVACQGAGPLTDELDRQGVRWHAVPTLDRPIRPRKDWLAYCQLYRLFQDQQFDIVHTHSSKPGILARVAARRAGVPHVVHHVRAYAFHEFSPVLKRCVYSRLETWAGRYCDRVLFVNHEEREMSVRSGWLPADKCQTIYNGADLSALDPRHGDAARARHRASWNVADDELAIVFVGRLDYPKQPLMIHEIARALEAMRPNAPWRLLVAGDGPEEAEVTRRVAESNLGHRVQFLGWQQDPHGVLHAADVVLLTSLAEGLPRALIEAQGAGRPIVASAAKGNREVVTPETGFLCAPKDAEDYARNLARLVDDPLLRKRMGRAARSRAEQHFDTVTNHRRIAALYDELLGVAAPAPAIRRAA
jgi:glycosyltransferase involved in cell wall biosynthesis